MAEVNGKQVTTEYSGKQEGDAINGKMSISAVAKLAKSTGRQPDPSSNVCEACYFAEQIIKIHRKLKHPKSCN